MGCDAYLRGSWDGITLSCYVCGAIVLRGDDPRQETSPHFHCVDDDTGDDPKLRVNMHYNHLELR